VQRRRKLAAGVVEFETYIRNNQESIPNYGERYRQGETISTPFIESMINQVVRRRSSSGTRCAGRYAGRTCCCRPGRRSSMTNWKMCFGDGTRYSESKRKLPDPRVSAALHIPI